MTLCFCEFGLWTCFLPYKSFGVGAIPDPFSCFISHGGFLFFPHIERVRVSMHVCVTYVDIWMSCMTVLYVHYERTLYWPALYVVVYGNAYQVYCKLKWCERSPSVNLRSYWDNCECWFYYDCHQSNFLWRVYNFSSALSSTEPFFRS